VDDAGRTVIMVTHDPVAAACADRVIFLADGQFRVSCTIRSRARSPIA